MTTVIFLLTPRHEVAQLAASLFRPLLERGISFLPLVTETGNVGDWKQVEQIFRSSKIPFKKLSDFHCITAYEILLKEKPSLLLTDNDLLGVHNAFVLSGQYLHIPTVVIRESTYRSKNSANFRWMFSEALAKSNQMPRLLKKYLFYIKSMAIVNPISLINVPKLIKEVILSNFQGKVVGQFAAYILANTEEDAEFLRSHCPSARFVRAVGNPMFDRTLKLDPTGVRRDIERMFNIPAGKKIVLFLSGSQVEHGLWTEEHKIMACREILDSLEMFCDSIHVIIKLHPIEKNVFPSIWKNYYNDFISVTESDISRLIQASDVVISWFSTAMLNVVLAKKPLIAMDFFNQRAQGILLLTEMIMNHGAAHEALNVKELCEALSNVIANGKLKDKLEQDQEVFRSKYLETIDDNSCDRIAETVAEIVGSLRKRE